jgi:predicted ribosomally synthesized peptide with nif11-like leader
MQRQVQSVQDLGGLLKLASSSGYNFTVEELQTVLKTAVKGELSESDLEQVSGGFSWGAEELNIKKWVKLNPALNLQIFPK